MSVSLSDLPTDGPGLVPLGQWHCGRRDNLSERMGGVWFRDGETVEPIDGRRLRRLVAAMGPSIVWARRVEDGLALGEAPGVSPAPAPEVPPSAPPAPPPAPAPAPPAPAPTDDSEDDGLDGLSRDELREFARKMDIDHRVDLRLSADKLRAAIREVMG